MKNKLVLALVLLTMMFVACGSGSSLVGKWVSEEDESSIELSKDGTGISEGYAFTWKAEKGRLTLNYGAGAVVAMDYKISGSTLTVTDDDGEISTFSKK